MRNNPGNGTAEEGEEAAPGTGTDFTADHGEGGTSLKPVERTMLEQILALQPTGDPTPEQSGRFLKELSPLESPHWNRFSLQEPMLMEDPCWSRFSFSLKGCRPWREPTLE